MLRKRLFTAGVGLSLALVILYFYSTVALNIAVSLISVMIVYELLVATKYLKNTALSILAIAFSAFIPFFKESYLDRFGTLTIFFFVIALFVIMLIYHKTLRLEQVGLVFFIVTAVPAAMSSLIYLRGFNYGNDDSGLFFILLALGFAWIADAGGLFVGMLFGKHKLAPLISPKKTVEGLIGGFACNIIFSVIMWFVFNNVFLIYTTENPYSSVLIPLITLNLPVLIGLSIISTALSVLGDLIASIVKRQCAIKDFGSIMPGHGGILDRFDSVLLVAPFVYFSFSTGLLVHTVNL
ncbi:MAG: phosphatidate cytidylyltransferase [Oscillospiraceae bacterium]|nr:phosphatidate cytidylyltransferase [Oscillospiraceae bacterium]